MADRYAVLQKLSDPQNALLGVAAGMIEAASTQPLTYLKNTLQQRVALSANPRVIYRGTPASMFADGTIIGTQFLACGWLQKRIAGGADRPLTAGEEVGAAWLAGFASGVPAAVLELTMIQQQRFGGTARATLGTILRERGVAGLGRGFIAASQREAFFTVGYLGVGPRIQRVCDGWGLGPMQSAAAGACSTGVVAAGFTHPFDTCKTVMQGDLRGPGLVATARGLYADGGVAAFYRGYPARAAMICACFFIFNETKLRLGVAIWPGQLLDETPEKR
jgi:hypothetical protein